MESDLPPFSVEVTRFNFASIQNELVSEVENCTFVAIDLELSGLRSVPGYCNSLFDTGEDRYTKIVKGTPGLIATQVGLSLFQYDPSNNTYNSSTYAFHLSPQSIGSIRQNCTFEGNVIGFLKSNNFDFNKFAYEGLSYLNRNERDILRKEIINDTLEDNMDSMDIQNIDVHITRVQLWMSSQEDSIIIREGNFNHHNIILYKLLQRYSNISIKIEKDQIVVSKNGKSKLDRSLEDTVLWHANGFSNIIELLVKHKKPIVLHNPLMDLIFIYNQFIAPLPKAYKDFKNRLNDLFPRVYDTKFIFNTLRDLVKKEIPAKNSSLENLYNFFIESTIGCSLGLYPPKILNRNSKIDLKMTKWFHHAGWDAFCTGACFIKLCHWEACNHIGTCRSMSVAEHFAAVNKYTNKIYLGRGAQPHLCLNESDPKTHRPKLLYLETMENKTINLSEVAKFIGTVESVDVKRYNKKSALIASINEFGNKKILNHFKKNDKYKICIFNPIQHSPTIRLALWGSFFISTTGLVILLLRTMK